MYIYVHIYIHIHIYINTYTSRTNLGWMAKTMQCSMSIATIQDCAMLTYDLVSKENVVIKFLGFRFYNKFLSLARPSEEWMQALL